MLEGFYKYSEANDINEYYDEFNAYKRIRSLCLASLGIF